MSDTTRDRIEGNVDQAKGTVKDSIGKVTDDNQRRGEGQMDNAKGKGKEGIADVKDGIDDLSKNIPGRS